jgi:glutamyl-tRNA synthetase
MGWSMPDDREKFSLTEMEKAFDINRVSLGGPVFDVEKLAWLNGLWLRDLSDEGFLQALSDWAFNRDYALKVIPHIKSRVETLSDVTGKAGFCFSGFHDITPASFANDKIDADTMKEWLQLLLWSYETERHWTKDNLFHHAKALADARDVKVKDLLFPVFIAIAGNANSFSVVDSMEIIGPDLSRARLRQAIQVLGGISKKQGKTLEKEWQEAHGKASS